MLIAEIFSSFQGEGRLTGTPSIFVRVGACNLRCRFCDTPYASWSPEGEDLSVDEIFERVQNCQESIGRVRNSAIMETELCPIAPQPRQLENCAAHSPLATRHCPLSTVHCPQPPCPTPLAPRPSVVLTGGEPMLFAELIPLCEALRKGGWHITIETAGTLYLPVVCDLMSISPKLSNSTPSPERDPRWTWRHEMNRHAPEVIERLIAEYDYQIKFVIEEFVDCEEVESYLAAMPKIDRARVMLMPQGIDLLELGAKNQWLEPYCARQGLIFCPRKHIEWFGAGRGK